MSKKEKNKIFSNMKNLLNETTTIKKETYELTKQDIEKAIDINIFKEMTKDEKIVNLLINSSVELFQIQAKNAIDLGKVFKNVFDELGGEGSKYTGLYEKWLVANSVSKSTALRYRKRYEIYSEVHGKGKNIVAVLPQVYIEHIYNENNKEKYLSLFKDETETKEVINKIKSMITIENKPEQKEIKSSLIEIDFNSFENIFVNIKEKTSSLKEKEKLEINKHLEKIQKILNKN